MSPSKRSNKEPRKKNRTKGNAVEEPVTYWTLFLNEDIQKSTQDTIQNEQNFNFLTNTQDICKEIEESDSVAEDSMSHSTSNKSKDCTQNRSLDVNTNKSGIFRRFLNIFHNEKSNCRKSRNDNKISKQNRHQLSNGQNKSKEYKESISTIEKYKKWSTLSKSNNFLQVHDISTDRLDTFRKKETLDTCMTSPSQKNSNEFVGNSNYSRKVVEDSPVTAEKHFLPLLFYDCQPYNCIRKMLLPSKDKHASFSEQQLNSLSELEVEQHSENPIQGASTYGNFAERLTDIRLTGTVQEKTRSKTRKSEEEFCVKQKCKEVKEIDSGELVATRCSSYSPSLSEISCIKKKSLLTRGSKEEKCLSMKSQLTDFTKVDSDKHSIQEAFIGDNYPKHLTNFYSNGTIRGKTSIEPQNTEEGFYMKQQCKEPEETDSRELFATELCLSYFPNPTKTHSIDSKNLSISASNEEGHTSVIAQLSYLTKVDKNSSQGKFIDDSYAKFCSTEMVVREKTSNKTIKTENDFSTNQQYKKAEEAGSRGLFPTGCSSYSCNSLKNSSAVNKKFLLSACNEEKYSSMKSQQTELVKVDSNQNSAEETFIGSSYKDCLTNLHSTGAVKKKSNNEAQKTEKQFRIKQQSKYVEEEDSLKLFSTGCSSCSLDSSKNYCSENQNLLITDNIKEKYSTIKAHLTNLTKNDRPRTCVSGNDSKLQVEQPIDVSFEKRSSFGSDSDQTDNDLKTGMDMEEILPQSFLTASMEHLNQTENVTVASNSELQQPVSNVEVGLYDVRVYGDVVNSIVKEEEIAANYEGDNAKF